MRRVSSAALMANANVPVDDEVNKSCEDISDIDLNDVTAKLEATLKSHKECVNSVSVSLFNLNLDEYMLESAPMDAIEHLKERAGEEHMQWQNLLAKVLKESKVCAIQQDTFEPREEQQQYLKACPNLQNFVRGSLPFINKVSRFLSEYQDLLGLQDELTEHVQFRLNSQTNIAMHRNLANAKQRP